MCLELGQVVGDGDQSIVRPRIDTTRHCTPELSTDPTVVGTGPTSLLAGRMGSACRSLMTVRPRPSAARLRT